MNSGIYKWTNKVNGKVYIGQTKDLSHRKSVFQCFSIKRYSGDLINRARQKYNNISYWNYEVLEYCCPEDLDKKEIYYIDLYDSTNLDNGYNLCGGGFGKGKITYHLTEDHKKKIGDAQRGEKNHRFGVPITDEEREERRNRMLGEKNPMYNKTHTDEVKQLLCELKSIPIVQLDMDNNFIREWISAKEAGNELGYDNSNITKCCKGKKNYYKGYKWSYSREYFTI